MYATLKRIYKNTRNILVLDRAIEEGWITEDDKARILLEVGAE